MSNLYTKDAARKYQNGGLPVRPPIWKGRRTQRICSFRGSYANRGNGMELGSSDVYNLYTKDASFLI